MLHDWEPVGWATGTLRAPLCLFAEVPWLVDHTPNTAPVQVTWGLDHPESAVPALLIQRLIPGRLGALPWTLTGDRRRLLTTAQKAAADRIPTLVLGTSNAGFRVAWFRDRNSGWRCHQWVLVLEHDTRAILAGVDPMWAGEHRARLTLSLVFDRLPMPGSILSAAIEANQGVPVWSYGNTDLARQLIDDGAVRARPATLPPSPGANIPPFPDDPAAIPTVPLAAPGADSLPVTVSVPATDTGPMQP